MSKKSLKTISLEEMQEAFSKALTELVGRECKVIVDELRFDRSPAQSFAGTDKAFISGYIEAQPDYSSDLIEPA